MTNHFKSISNDTSNYSDEQSQLNKEELGTQENSKNVRLHFDGDITTQDVLLAVKNLKNTNHEGLI